MTGLLLFVIAATAVAFIACFVVSNRLFRYWTQGSFLAGLGLVALVGYFTWREHRTVSEPARLIDPVPGIIDVTYAPTPAELQALAGAMAAIPGDTWTGNTQAQRRDLARRLENLHARYRLLKTALAPEEVISFYAEPAHRRGWNVGTRNGSWIIMKGDAGSLVVFVATDWPRPGTRVLYIHEG